MPRVMERRYLVTIQNQRRRIFLKKYSYCHHCCTSRPPMLVKYLHYLHYLHCQYFERNFVHFLVEIPVGLGDSSLRLTKKALNSCFTSFIVVSRWDLTSLSCAHNF